MCQILLNVQVVVLDVGRPQALIHCKHVGRAKTAINGPGTRTASRDRDRSGRGASNGLQSIRGERAVRDRSRSYVVEQRAGVGRSIGDLTSEEVLGERVVSESVAGADPRLSGGEYVVGNADTGRKIVVVLRVEAARTAARSHLHDRIG